MERQKYDSSGPTPYQKPKNNCVLCPRLSKFREYNQKLFPDWFNGAVPSFGHDDAVLLIVGLAPGLKGANRTGRPFTGDYAGDVLYPTLLKHKLAIGKYGKNSDDGLRLNLCRITNAVRCVPPENKPTASEQRTCRPFLKAEIKMLERLEVIMALGQIAHRAVLSCLEERQASFPFIHGQLHTLRSGLILADSYHCSRYNINTRRLTKEMFEALIADITNLIGRKL